MKAAVLFLCAVLLSGCGLRRRQVAAAPPPAPPKPAAVKPAPAPPPAAREPLSIPQTEARLPEPQPIPPEALATAQLPTPPSVEVPAAKPGRVTGPPPPPAPKMEAEAPAPEAPAPRIQTLMTAAERRRLERAITARRQEIQAILARLQANSPTAEQREAIDRVNSFLALAAQAAERGDLRQADALSSRALSLAQGFTQ